MCNLTAVQPQHSASSRRESVHDKFEELAKLWKESAVPSSPSQTLTSSSNNVESSSNSSSSWDADFEELEESNRALEERIAMLQRSLEQTQEKEREEVKEVRARVCSSERKEAIREEVRKEVTKAAEREVQLSSHLDIIEELQATNKQQGARSQKALLPVFAMYNTYTRLKRERQSTLQCVNVLEQSNSRLHKATQDSLVYVQEVKVVSVKALQAKNDDLLAELQACGLEYNELKHEIQKAKTDTDDERNARRIYGRAVSTLLHKVQHHAKIDHTLLTSINKGFASPPPKPAPRIEEATLKESTPLKPSPFFEILPPIWLERLNKADEQQGTESVAPTQLSLQEQSTVVKCSDEGSNKPVSDPTATNDSPVPNHEVQDTLVWALTWFHKAVQMPIQRTARLLPHARYLSRMRTAL